MTIAQFLTWITFKQNKIFGEIHIITYPLQQSQAHHTCSLDFALLYPVQPFNSVAKKCINNDPLTINGVRS